MKLLVDERQRNAAQGKEKMRPADCFRKRYRLAAMLDTEYKEYRLYSGINITGATQRISAMDSSTSYQHACELPMHQKVALVYTACSFAQH